MTEDISVGEGRRLLLCSNTAATIKSSSIFAHQKLQEQSFDSSVVFALQFREEQSRKTLHFHFVAWFENPAVHAGPATDEPIWVVAFDPN